MTTRTQDASLQYLLSFAGSLPAVWAAWTVILYVIAALLPLSVFIVLFGLHVLASLTMLLGESPRKKKIQGPIVIEDHLCELSLLLFAVMLSIGIDSSEPWMGSLGNVAVRFAVLVASALCILAAKVKILRQTLLHHSHATLDLRQSVALIAASCVGIVVVLGSLSAPVTDVMTTHLLQLRL